MHIWYVRKAIIGSATGLQIPSRQAFHRYQCILLVGTNVREISTKIKTILMEKTNMKTATTKLWQFCVRLKCIMSMSAYIILCLTATQSAIYNKLLANILLLYWMHDIYGWHIGVIHNIYLIFPGTPVSINTITITDIYGVAFLQPLMARASCTYELLMLGRFGVLTSCWHLKTINWVGVIAARGPSQ